MAKFIMEFPDGVDEEDADQLFDEVFESMSTCGRWRNGRLAQHCMSAGTEDCQFCPYAKTEKKPEPRP